MAGVSDIGTRLSQQFILQVLRNQMAETERQVSTGKKSTTIAGLGPSGVSQSITLRGKFNMLETYTGNLSNAKMQYEVMDNTLLSMNDTARDVLSTLRKQVQGNVTGTTIITSVAESALTVIQDKLNTQFNGRFLFAGDDITNAPIADRALLNTNMSALVTGWMAGTPTVNDIITDARAVVNTNLGYNNGTILSGSVTARIDDGTDTDMTLRASESGFPDILRSLSIIANLPQPTTQAEQDNYWTIVNGAISMLDAATTAVDQTQAVMGSRAKTVDDMILSHSLLKGNYEQLIGEVEDIDAAEAATKFQSLQARIETSYMLIAQMRNLNLTSFLR